MELTVKHETVSMNEIVLDTVSEQSIECDFILPDYCPDIVKILKCRVTPKILSKSMMSDKLTIEGVAIIHLMYLCDKSNQIKTYTHKWPFSKVMDVKSSSANPFINVRCKTSYSNCRAVSPRKMDIRGAVSMFIKVSTVRTENVLTDCADPKTYLRKRMVNCSSLVNCVSKQFSLKEDIEDSDTNGEICGIIRCTGDVFLSDYKIVSNKIIIRGECKVCIVYMEDSEDSSPRTLTYKLPISQIIDIDYIDEDCMAVINLSVQNINCDFKSNPTGEGSIFTVEAVINADVKAYKNMDCTVISDAYSTQFELESVSKNVMMERFIDTIKDEIIHKAELDVSADDLSCIYDVVCEPMVASVTWNEFECTAVINLNFCILGQNSDSLPTYLEKSCSIEYVFAINPTCGQPHCDARVFMKDLSCSLDSGTLMVKAAMCFEADVYTVCKEIIVYEIEVDTTKEKCRCRNNALTIYYADKDECVWDIAKKYNTSVVAVMEENGLEAENLIKRCMLLIPIIS